MVVLLPCRALLFKFLFSLFEKKDDRIEYALFKRADAGYWQAIAGGGELEESPLQAARREAFEEGSISPSKGFIELSSTATVPVVNFPDHLWGKDIFVIPEYCFGIDVTGTNLVLSHEHSELCWADYEKAVSLLKWDSNKNALWELNARLDRNSG